VEFKKLRKKAKLMAVIIELKVIPNSKEHGFLVDKSGVIKCRLKSKPEGGKANEELLRLMSKLTGVPTDCFKILRGATSRNKMIKIDVDADLNKVLALLGVQVQTRIE
jgi:uncharacterized protein (TIGR00251 family)